MGNTGKLHKAVPYSSTIRPKKVSKNGSIPNHNHIHNNDTNTVTNNNDQGTDESFDGDFFDCCGADTNNNASGETTALELLAVMETIKGTKSSSSPPTKGKVKRVSSGDASCEKGMVVEGRRRQR
eukprot:scaffold123422_cov35-Attheya_sp.AAC.1